MVKKKPIEQTMLYHYVTIISFHIQTGTYEKIIHLAHTKINKIEQNQER